MEKSVRYVPDLSQCSDGVLVLVWGSRKQKYARLAPKLKMCVRHVSWTLNMVGISLLIGTNLVVL